MRYTLSFSWERTTYGMDNVPSLGMAHRHVMYGSLGRRVVWCTLWTVGSLHACRATRSSDCYYRLRNADRGLRGPRKTASVTRLVSRSRVTGHTLARGTRSA